MGNSQIKLRRHQTSLAVALPMDAFDDPPNAVVFFSTPFLLRLEGEQTGHGLWKRFTFRTPDAFEFLSAHEISRDACMEPIPTQASLMTCHRPGADRVNVKKQQIKTPIGLHDIVTLYGNVAHGKYLQCIPNSTHNSASGSAGGDGGAPIELPRFQFNASPNKVRQEPKSCSEFVLKPALKRQTTRINNGASPHPLRFGDLVSFTDTVTGQYLFVSRSGIITMSSHRRSLFSVQNPTLLQLVKIRDMVAAAAAAEATSITMRHSQDVARVGASMDEEEEDVFLPLMEDPTSTSLWNGMKQLPIEVVIRVLSYRRNFLGTARLLSKSWRRAAEMLVRSIRVNGDFAMFHVEAERHALVSLVSRCMKLEKLRLKNILELTDDEVELMNLRSHSQLKHVEMGGCRCLTDRATFEVAQIPHLEYLNLAATNISDVSLSIMGSLTHVQVINLYGCRVTAKGINECAQKSDEKPTGLLHLGHLNLRGTVVNRDDVTNFIRRRPSVEVLIGPPKQETVFG